MVSLRIHKFNEIVFQLLFSFDMGECVENDIVSLMMHELLVTRKTVLSAYSHAKSIHEAHGELDQIISNISRDYQIKRIGRVEKNIIRYALYFMKSKTTSHKKIISEALRLTQKFSTKESAAYVNALLDEASAKYDQDASFSTPN
ncbi:MAG: transcription antitermination factor NusB [Chlamydiales bacterium]